MYVNPDLSIHLLLCIRYQMSVALARISKDFPLCIDTSNKIITIDLVERVYLYCVKTRDLQHNTNILIISNFRGFLCMC